MADETLSIVMRVLGVRDVEQDTNRAAASIEQLDAAAVAASQGLSVYAVNAERAARASKSITGSTPDLGIRAGQYTFAGAAIELMRTRLLALRNAFGSFTFKNPFQGLSDSGKGATDAFAAISRVARQTSTDVLAGVPVIGRYAAALGTLGPAAGVIAAVGVSVAGLLAAVKEAAESEQAIRKLDVALQSTGQFTTAASQGLQDFATALEQTTGVSDEAILGVSALLAQVGRLSGTELQRATKAALDLAAVLGTDVQTAALQLSKAAEGNVEALQRVGITIDESIPKGERFAAVLRKVEENLGGSAAANAQTLQGSLSGLGAAFSDLQEEMGRPFVGPFADSLRGLTIAIEFLRSQFPIKLDAEGSLLDFLSQAQRVVLLAGDDFDSMRERLERFADTKLDPVKITFEKGNAEEIRTLIATIKQELASIGDSPTDVRQAALVDFLKQLKQQAAIALAVRTDLDRDSLDETLASVRQQLRPQTILVKFEAELSGVDAALRHIESSKVALTPDETALRATLQKIQAERHIVPVELGVNKSDIESKLQGITKAEQITIGIKADLQAAIPTADAAELERIGNIITTQFNDAARTGTDAGNKLADAWSSVLDLFLRLQGTKVDKLFEAPALGPLNQALSLVRDFRAEVEKKPAPLGAPDAKDIASALVGIRSDFQAASKAGTASADAIESRWKALAGFLKQAGDAVPALRGQFEPLMASLKPGTEARIKVLLDGEQAKRDASVVRESVAKILSDAKASPVKIFDARQAITDATAITAATDALGQAIDSLDTSNLEQVTAAFNDLSSKLEEARKPGSEISAPVIALLEAKRAQVEAALKALEPLRQAQADHAKFRLDVDSGDIEAARDDVAALDADLAKLPKNKEIVILVKGDKEALSKLDIDKALEPVRLDIELGDGRKASRDLDAAVKVLESNGPIDIKTAIDIRNLRRQLGQLSFLTKEAAEEAAIAFKEGMKGLGIATLENSFFASLQSIGHGLDGFKENFVNVFKTAVDEAEHILARLATSVAIRLLLSLFGGPVAGGIFGAVRGILGLGNITGGPGGTASKVGQQPIPQGTGGVHRFEPIVLVRPRIAIEVPHLAPVLLRIAVSTAEDVTIPAPGFKVTPAAPVPVRARTVLQGQPAPLAVRPAVALNLADLEPLSIDPDIVLGKVPPVTVKPTYTVAPGRPIAVDPKIRATQAKVEPLLVSPRLRLQGTPQLNVTPQLRQSKSDPLEVDPLFKLATPKPLEPQIQLRPKFRVSLEQPGPVPVSVAFGVVDDVKLPAPRVKVGQAPAQTVQPNLKLAAQRPQTITPRIQVEAPEAPTLAAARLPRAEPIKAGPAGPTQVARVPSVPFLGDRAIAAIGNAISVGATRGAARAARPVTADLLRASRERASVSILDRPSIAGSRDTVSRFLPPGRLTTGPAVNIEKIEALDALTFEQQWRRGKLGRAARSSQRFRG